MSWTDHAIFWHAYPLGFVGAEATATHTVTHRLPRLTNWLDHLVSLGANGLLLAPIFASQTHGYDTLDHYRIDPRLGDEQDFDNLLSEAKARGVRVVLDGVFNHLDRSHPIVTRALAAGPESAEGRWIKWAGEYPYGFEGNENLVELNLSNPAVADYIADVMVHWLDRGIDGWRLDAAYSAGADAWAPIVERVRAKHPEAWLLGEVLHGDYIDFVERSGVDSLTQYELWKAIWSSLNDTNFFELAWALERHQEFCDNFLPNTFVGNHDVTRIASQLTTPGTLPMAIALLLLLPGVPSIYAGDERGFTAVKTEGKHGDDAVRPQFPETPDGLLPFGMETFELHQRLISIRRQHAWLTRARMSVGVLTNETMTIELASGDNRLTLALNNTDEPVTLKGTYNELGVAPRGWALG